MYRESARIEACERICMWALDARRRTRELFTSARKKSGRWTEESPRCHTDTSRGDGVNKFAALSANQYSSFTFLIKKNHGLLEKIFITSPIVEQSFYIRMDLAQTWSKLRDFPSLDAMEIWNISAWNWPDASQTITHFDMATCAELVRGARAFVWPFACALVCFCCFSIASSNHHGGRLICWQAIFNCQSEPECHYAYDQYLHACESILNGQRRKCPSHCISSLVQLNLTKSGPALEDCSCNKDPRCREIKRAIEPCLPKTSNMGCTEARRQCEKDSQCRSAMGDYLVHCGKLFSGSSCSNQCRNVIAYMRKLPKAQLLDTCVCDGTERTICEFIKTSMRTLCFDSPPVDEEGSSGLDDDEPGDEDYLEPEPTRNTGSAFVACSVLTVVASILALVPLPWSLWSRDNDLLQRLFGNSAFYLFFFCFPVLSRQAVSTFIP